ncbi:hypothetical protein, partial [Sulfobacillus harzensis]
MPSNRSNRRLPLLADGPLEMRPLPDAPETWSERFRLAGDPRTSAEMLRVLAGDRDEAIRRRVADNPATPPIVLSAMVDDVISVRKAVAANPATPAFVRAELAKDAVWIVRVSAQVGPLSDRNAPPPRPLPHLPLRLPPVVGV